MPFMFFGFGFGFFFLIFSIAINLKYFKALISLKSFHFIVKNTLVTGLLVTFLTALNYIFFHQPLFFDITDNKIHSLSPFTRELVNSLDDKTHFHYLHVDNKRVRGYENLLRKEVRKYQALNPKIHFQSHSVFKRPDLVKKFGLGDEESSLFVEFKGRIQRIFDLDERAFANVFLKLIKPPKKLYFLQLKDERHLESDSTFGLKGLKGQLERLHYQVDRMESLEKFPEDLSVLALIGSRKPFSEEERGQLDSYLQRGGSLLVALDPGEDHNLNPLLKTYGLQVDNNFIFSGQAQVGQSKLLVLTHKGGEDHRVNRGIREGQNPALFLSSSVSISEESLLEKKKFKITPVLEYLPDSTGHIDIDPSSPVVSQGRQWASVISEGRQGNNNFRLAVVGDSDFLTNQFYSHQANFDFALNLFYYLSQDEDLLKIKTPLPKTTDLRLTQTQMNHYFIFFVLPLPFIFFILSAFFKLRRFF